MTISPELEKQIDAEAKAEAKKMTARVPIFRHGYEAGWYDASEKYGLKWEQAEAMIEKMKDALDAIAYPVRHLQEQAKKEGAALNGEYTVRIADDPNWLCSKAVEALADYNTYKNGKDGK